MRLFPALLLHSSGPGTDVPVRLEGRDIMASRLKAQANVASVIHIASDGACRRLFTALQHDGCAGNIR